MKQITIFDIIQTGETPCGYLKEEQYYLIGRELDFQELKNLIGKKVICTSPTQSKTWYRVYKVIDYFENNDKFYHQVEKLPENNIQYSAIVNDYIHDVVGVKECMDCYELSFTCDRVALTDKDRSDSANAWVSEAYCSNGRFEPVSIYPETFFELQEQY